jgi:hypothetical protein
MKKILLLFEILLLCATGLAAQDQKVSDNGTFSLALSQDDIFGFYPAVYGSLPIKTNLDLTLYGIFWTNPSFGTLANGADSWLETGFGLGIPSANGTLFFNPFIGFTHGKLLSGGQSGVIGDGIVPGVAAVYNKDNLECEIFGSWYKALRKEGPVTADYILYWFLPGYKVSRRVTAGLHYEGFVLSRLTGSNAEMQYHVLGAFVKFNAGERFIFRFSAGKNLKKEFYSPDFYKLNLLIPF